MTLAQSTGWNTLADSTLLTNEVMVDPIKNKDIELIKNGDFNYGTTFWDYTGNGKFNILTDSSGNRAEIFNGGEASQKIIIDKSNLKDKFDLSMNYNSQYAGYKGQIQAIAYNSSGQIVETILDETLSGKGEISKLNFNISDQTSYIKVSVTGQIGDSFLFSKVSLIDHTDIDNSFSMPDPFLQKMVRKQLNLPENHIITASDVRNLDELVYRDFDNNLSKIHSLKGLEYALNLKKFQISGYGIENITDLSPLSNLPKLKVIAINNHLEYGKDLNRRGKLEDVSSLYKLDLDTLVIQGQNVSDLSVVRAMPNLQTISFSSNNVSDLRGVSELVKRGPNHSIGLQDNNISDLSQLSGAEKQDYAFNSNHITDFSPLAKGSKLTAPNQDIQLEPVGLLDPNFIKISLPGGEPLDIKFITPGTYDGKSLVWSNIGNNELTFSNNELLYKVNGTVKQELLDAYKK